MLAAAPLLPPLLESENVKELMAVLTFVGEMNYFYVGWEKNL